MLGKKAKVQTVLACLPLGLGRAEDGFGQRVENKKQTPRISLCGPSWNLENLARLLGGNGARPVG
eukprot:3088998-Pyramimonas_sp.AAC.1